MLQVFREPGNEIIAEDLGVVPDFVRASLARLSIPGYRVLRWERHWPTEGQPFKDPLEYLKRYRVAVRTVEQYTGLQFLRAIPKRDRKAQIEECVATMWH